ncbi:hypothetical protein Tco_1191620 [Tanacetum coccineum]
MEEYIRLEEEKAQNRGKVFNWETAKYGKIWYDEEIYDLRSIETEFPAIAFNGGVSSEKTLSCEPTVSSLNDKIDFRISFDDSGDEDYTDFVKRKIDDVGDVFTNLEILKYWSLETSRRQFNTQSCSQTYMENLPSKYQGSFSF